MRSSKIRRMPMVLLAVAGLLLATASSGLARPAASLSDCPSGRVGLLVQWANAHASVLCGPEQHSEAMEIVGLVVRWSDGNVGTIDLAPAAETSTSIESSMSSESTVSSESSMSDNNSSYSSSSSTSCVNGHCTTTTCVDGRCSNQP